MARPKKLLDAATKNLTIEEKEAKLEEEKALYNYERINFKNYPTALLKQAKKEWDRIAKILGELPLSELDQQTLIRYCNYSYLYAQATADLTLEGSVIEGRANPLVNIMNSYSKELKAATSELGLTINSRLRITTPKSEAIDDDPFAKMFGDANA
ncbi:phage terminase small subunit P27 family [Enterococcus sp. AZ102]|uniref:phage terminase small subunit P27 family n=1 Tax=Enterococcus sp. AZ102 TaxID=2774865 RepID=UPI003F277C9E